MPSDKEEFFLKSVAGYYHVERVGYVNGKEQIDLDCVGVAVFEDNRIKKVSDYDSLPRKKGRLVYYLERK